MRHAQYRQELADAVHAATGLPVAAERSDPATTLPALAVQWTGSRLSRTATAGGWLHSYDVEIRVGAHGVELDGLVATVGEAVAAWKPNTSQAAPSPPDIKPVQVIDGDISYPAVLVSTVVTEPST